MEKRDPKLKHDVGFFIRVDEEFRRVLDQLRRDEPDLPTRAEFIRRLVFEKYEQRRKGKK
jgi:hypothetical protein